jgi:glucose dehydrogenase
MSTKAIRSMTPFVALLIAAGVAAPAAQRGAKNGEWTAYGADPGNTRYSPLDQINWDQDPSTSSNRHR